MQLKDLVVPIDKQTDDELLERLRSIRHNREVIRPAARRIVEKADKKAATKKASALSKQLELLSEEDKQKLIQQLTEGE